VDENVAPGFSEGRLEAFLFHPAIDGRFTHICSLCRSIGRIRHSKSLNGRVLFRWKLFIHNDLIFPMRVFASI